MGHPVTYFPEGSGGSGGVSGGTRVAVTSALSAAGGTSSITLDLPVVATPGSYTSVTIDAYGRVTAGGAAPGSGGTEVRITSRLSAAFDTSLVTLDLPGVGTAGSYNSVTVDAYGRVTAGQMVAASSGTSLTPASAISMTVGSSNVTLDLTATGVTAGSSYNSLTVDARGRITNAQTVAASSGTSMTPASAISMTVGSSNVTLDLTATGVTAGSSYNSLTVDARGRVTGAETVAGGSGNSLLWTSALSGQVTGSTVTLDLSATGIAAGSYNSVTVDDRGRVTAGQVVSYGGATSSIVSLSANTGRVNVNLGDSEVSFPLVSGHWYKWSGYLAFMTQATTTGLRFGATVPSFTGMAGTGEVPVAAGGTGGVYHSYFTASGVSITGTGVALAGVNYLARFYGMILPSSNGTFVLQFASEVNASRVSLMAGSFIEYWQLT